VQLYQHGVPVEGDKNALVLAATDRPMLRPGARFARWLTSAGDRGGAAAHVSPIMTP